MPFERIKYTSQFIDLPCLALFDRDGMAGRLEETLLSELKDLDEALDWLETHKVALV